MATLRINSGDEQIFFFGFFKAFGATVIMDFFGVIKTRIKGFILVNELRSQSWKMWPARNHLSFILFGNECFVL